jgi:anti-sigma factor RsiW
VLEWEEREEGIEIVFGDAARLVLSTVEERWVWRRRSGRGWARRARLGTGLAATRRAWLGEVVAAREVEERWRRRGERGGWRRRSGGVRAVRAVGEKEESHVGGLGI